MKPKPKGATPRKTFRLSEYDLERLEYIRANYDWPRSPVEIAATTTNAMRLAIGIAHEVVTSNIATARKKVEK